MRLMLEVRQMHQSSDPAVRLVDHIVRSNHNSESEQSMSPASHRPSPYNANNAAAAAPAKEAAGPKGLQDTLIAFLENLDADAPGSLRRSGVVNHANKSLQTLLHLATIMGYSRLLRRLIIVGGHLDVQDVNGFTPLAFAALCGQTLCARALLEAGASYDIPTNLGEMPLDLAKLGDHVDAERILLSSVWLTTTDDGSVASIDEIHDTLEPSGEAQLDSEIDDDNPSSQSDGAADSITPISRLLRTRRRRTKRVAGDKGRSRRVSPEITPTPTPRDDPPPYAPPDQGSWMSRLSSNINIPNPHIPGWNQLHSLWGDKAVPPGWIAFPAPSWDTLQKVTSPEDIKLFTQAMAAAALNAVVQSGATTSGARGAKALKFGKESKHQRRASGDSQSSSGRLSTSEVVRTVKRESTESETNAHGTPTANGNVIANGEVTNKTLKAKAKGIRRLTFTEDRMLYLFWLPVLLFVGFWLVVTALPIATGFCLIYARQISRAIKQRL
jgi:hypothetical protein